MRVRSSAILAGAMLIVLATGMPPVTTQAPAPAMRARRPPKPERCAPPVSQRMYAPLPAREWSDGELLLNNRSANPMTVYSAFFRRGQSVAGASVTLAPAEVRWIRLTDLDGTNGQGVTRSDGLELSYLGTMLEIGAQLTLTGLQGGSADVPFSMPGDYVSHVQEAVWPTSPGVRAFVGLANATDAFVVANVERPGTRAEEVRLPPRSTVTLPDPERREGRDDRPGVDWMRLSYRGAIGSVRATGLLERRGRLVGSVRFYDPAAARQSDLFATNLPLGGNVPVMVLKNTSNAALSVMPMFMGPDGDGSGAVTLPAMLLGAGAASVVDLSPLVEAAAAGTVPDHVSVRVQSTGAPGSLIGSLLASQTGHAGVSDVPLRDTGPVRQSTGSYPWRIDGDYTTLVSITNVSDRPARYHIRIAFDGGEYAPNIPELAPHASAFFDLRSLRDQGVPDRKGRNIPGQATHGQFHWSILMSGGETKLVGRADVFSRQSGRRSSYSCPDCCPDSWTGYSYLDPGSLSVPLGNTNDVVVISAYQDCYQNIYETSANSISAYWNVEAPSVTSMSNVYYGLARAQGNQDGDTGISGDFTEERFMFHADFCELEQPGANVAGQVQVGCPISTVGAHNPDPYPLNTTSMTAGTQTALTCLRNAVQGAGGTLNVVSAYRPQSYQDHLQEVWDKWQAIKNRNDAACAANKAQVQTEWNRHGLGFRPADHSDHTDGIAFDANWTGNLNIDSLAGTCQLSRPVPNDDTHFRYNGS